MHTPNEFAAVLGRRGLIRGFCLDVHVSDTNQCRPRLGLIVAKRLAKRAVTRNLIKRQIREAFRQRAGVLPNVDIVFRMAKKLELLGSEAKEQKLALRVEVEGLLGRIEARERLGVKPQGA